jgi:hypothetical protein
MSETTSPAPSWYVPTTTPSLLIPATYVNPSPGIAIVVKAPWFNRNPCALSLVEMHWEVVQYRPTMSPESLIA